jgi:hypothetical protein
LGGDFGLAACGCGIQRLCGRANDDLLRVSWPGLLWAVFFFQKKKHEKKKRKKQETNYLVMDVIFKHNQELW